MKKRVFLETASNASWERKQVVSGSMLERVENLRLFGSNGIGGSGYVVSGRLSRSGHFRAATHHHAGFPSEGMPIVPREIRSHVSGAHLTELWEITCAEWHMYREGRRSGITG